MGEDAHRPVIGVTMSRYKSRIARFFDWLSIRRKGGCARFLAPGAGVDLDGLDGLVVGGGDDISADIYGGEIDMDVRIDPERDRLELELLKGAVARDMPVLGICRGAQIMNVYFGGSLHTDIRGLPRDKTAMRTVLAKKVVTLFENTRVRDIIGRAEVRVNSLHHQAVDRLGRDIAVAGRDRGDFVQALEHTGLGFFVGVQWHPEFLVFRREHQNLFGALIKAAHGYRRRRLLGE
jgi:putative glutamine amidotransferase